MAPLVVFVDEPGLTAAMHAGFPLDPNRTIDLVSSALATLEPHAVTGLHCCGWADWRVVLQAGPQILSLPLDSGAVEHSGALERLPRARRSRGVGRGAHHRPASAPRPSACGSTSRPSGARSPRAAATRCSSASRPSSPRPAASPSTARPRPTS